MAPLNGITIVSIEQAVAAPFATRQLADLGARVIKIERPQSGDFARSYDASVNGLSSYFVWLNRSKESLTLDLKRREAIGILAQLIARADVVVQNLAPGAMDRLGLSAAELRQRHPGLIVCAITGYGSSGPYATKKAYDLLVQGEAGLLSVTGTEDQPSRTGISVADIAAGMYAYSGILTALLTRVRTQQGAALEVSLFDALAEWMSAPAYFTAYSGMAPPRTGPNHASIAPYGPFDTRDSGAVMLGIQNAREWERFCRDVLERPDLANDPAFSSNPARVTHRAVLKEKIEDAFRALTADQLFARLELAQIAYARARSVTEFVDHPQLSARERWRTIASPAGPLQALLPPVQMDSADPVMGAIPAVGQHTDAILDELGFDAPTIAAWRTEGMI